MRCPNINIVLIVAVVGLWLVIFGFLVPWLFGWPDGVGVWR